MMIKHKHDNFFRTVFSNPEYARKLLLLAAKENATLRQFIELVNLNSLRQIPGDAPREGLSGNADLAFHVELANSREELLVGIVFEHKSFPDQEIRMQLLKYYFEVMEQKSPGTPMVAIVVYNGKKKWNGMQKPYPKYPRYFQEVGLPFRVEFIDIGKEISEEEFNSLEPDVKLALVAMRYVFDTLGMKEKFSSIVGEFIRSPRKDWQKIIDAVLVYLKDSLDNDDKEILMDTEEALRNKGFISIADAERMEIEALQKEKETLNKEKETLNKENKSLNKENKSLNKELDDEREKNARLKARIRELEGMSSNE